MLLSNVVNNAAAAVLMAPIAMTLAREMGLSSDPFLMAVAVGASCAFLTPVGHQSNALVMGPGGYQFGITAPGTAVVHHRAPGGGAADSGFLATVPGSRRVNLTWMGCTSGVLTR